MLQIAPPNDVYARPVNLFVAQFVGEMNFVPGKVAGANEIESPWGKMQAAVPSGVSVGAKVTLAIRPEHVDVQPLTQNSSPYHGKITSKNYLGDSALFEVESNGVTLLAKLAGDSELDVGQKAAIDLPSNRWHVFP